MRLLFLFEAMVPSSSSRGSRSAGRRVDCVAGERASGGEGGRLQCVGPSKSRRRPATAQMRLTRRCASVLAACNPPPRLRISLRPSRAAAFTARIQWRRHTNPRKPSRTCAHRSCSRASRHAQLDERNSPAPPSPPLDLHMRHTVRRLPRPRHPRRASPSP